MCSGSAPRARGTRRQRARGRQRVRVSPACAGNTRALGLEGTSLSGQPRVRGEHPAIRLMALLMDGSAPRARGTRGRAGRAEVEFRVSPACAGNTHDGEARAERVDGSAPRARGTPTSGARTVRASRVSPACAGNTWPAPSLKSNPAGQPRVRGEHGRRDPLGDAQSGSAPRARGNTIGRGPAWPSITGQPRVRGEHDGSTRSAVSWSGSAPRARGTRPTDTGPAAGNRVSPACAGNTARSRPPETAATGQPRVRGEHHFLGFVSTIGNGSAPRARGTP